MRVCGIDLGTITGLAVVVPNGSFGSVLHHRSLRSLDIEELLEAVSHAIEVFEVGLVCCERAFVGGYARITASQREKFTMVKLACKRHGVKLVTYSPSEIKKAITGNGRASKEQMQRAVQSLLGFAAPNEHVADAACAAAVGLSREGR